MKEIQILIKSAGGACDINCRYCFYKDELSHRSHEVTALTGKMSEEVMEALIRKGLNASMTCTFAFQGGEPTLAGLDFYKAFTETVEKYRKQNQQVFYTIQTNGVGLSEEWGVFFKKYSFLVGVSLDGIRKTHDANRFDHHHNGTFVRVMENIRMLKERHVEVNVLCVLNRQTAERIEAVYQFFMRRGLYYQQYIPCLDPIGEERGVEDYSLLPKQYGDALKRLFDQWFEDKRKGIPVSVRQFDNYLCVLAGGAPEACAMYGKCSMQNVVEADGTVYPCDFYALDEYAMGNILDMDFKTLRKETLRERAGAFFENPTQRDDRCGTCRWYPLCRGGCKRDCEVQDGTWRNVYCEAYQEFFSYAIGRLEWLAERV